jgi:hypothetical protein
LNARAAPSIVARMYRIRISALLIAFFAEFVVDVVMQMCLLSWFAGGAISRDMTQDDFRKVVEAVSAMPSFTFAAVVLGSASTFGGGYLAARIARQYPYYHGLGMGLLGIAGVLYYWQAGPLWLSLLGLVSNIPLAIWGAHVAKRHMPAPE